MHVLVTNDDGIESDGLWALADAAARLGSVTVVAPHVDQSGQSVSIRLRHPVAVQRRLVGRPGDAQAPYATFAVEASPATCVLLACGRLAHQPFDLVLAGINHGANVASDIWLSGTVGAARMGSLLGIPALAVSVDHDRRTHDGSLYWADIASIAAELGRGLVSHAQPLLLNLNVPNQPCAALGGLLATAVSLRSRIAASQVLEVDPSVYSVRFQPWAAHLAEPGSDLWALDHGLASVSLLTPHPSDAPALDLAALCGRVSRDLGITLAGASRV